MLVSQNASKICSVSNFLSATIDNVLTSSCSKESLKGGESPKVFCQLGSQVDFHTNPEIALVGRHCSHGGCMRRVARRDRRTLVTGASHLVAAEQNTLSPRPRDVGKGAVACLVRCSAWKIDAVLKGSLLPSKINFHGNGAVSGCCYSTDKASKPLGRSTLCQAMYSTTPVPLNKVSKVRAPWGLRCKASTISFVAPILEAQTGSGKISRCRKQGAAAPHRHRVNEATGKIPS